MKNGICYIVGAGENYGLDFQRTQDDFVIAADAGFRYLQETGKDADLVIGDFDTLKYLPEHANVIALSTEKDDTDMLAAVRQGVERGYTCFHIYCGTGGRLDHTLANLQVLAWLSENGMRGWLFDRDHIITAVTDAKLCLGKIPCGCLSVFSHSSRSGGVTLRGLKYELDHVVLTNTFPVGISNEFIGKESVISVESGTLLVIFPAKAKENLMDKS